MRLTRRLMLHGVVVPLLVIAAALAAVGIALRGLLLDAVDQALRAQATVESVSLFDRLDHAPHLHLDRSPLRSDMAIDAADSALYGPDGKLVVALPPDTAPERVRAPQASTAPSLAFEHSASGAPLRVLQVVVPAPDGRPHLLRLAQPLASLDATLSTYWRVALAVGALAAALLAGLQLGLLRGLVARLGVLRARVAELHEAGTSAGPQPDDDILALQAALERALTALAQTRRAEERLLADAAHELRTPLAAIRADIDVTLRRERTADELREALERAREEVDGLGNLATRLLDLTVLRLTAPASTPVEPLALVSQAEQALQRWEPIAAERRIALRLDVPSDLTAKVEAASLQQVLTNLIDNALRFAPAGSEVVLSAEQGPGGRVSLWVDDAGPGIPEADRERVFEPLHRLDRRGRGAGLGLAIVREVARSVGGEAFAGASSAGGARVGIRL